VEVRVLAGAPCDDGVDFDLDGWIDQDDPGCADGLFLVEEPVCQNGDDDDGDGLVDWPADPECVKATAHSERFMRCGLGAELAVGLGAWLAWRRRQSRRAWPVFKSASSPP
jgi:hypothetical protein